MIVVLVLKSRTPQAEGSISSSMDNWDGIGRRRTVVAIWISRYASGFQKKQISEKSEYQKKPLLIHRNLNDLFLDRVGHQLRFVVDIELAHQVELVRFHRLHA